MLLPLLGSLALLGTSPSLSRVAQHYWGENLNNPLAGLLSQKMHLCPHWSCGLLLASLLAAPSWLHFGTAGGGICLMGLQVGPQLGKACILECSAAHACGLAPDRQETAGGLAHGSSMSPLH